MANETIKYKFPYPESVDAPDVPYWQHALAAAVEDTVTKRFQHGSQDFVGNDTVYTYVDITFPVPFDTVPTVVAVPAGANSQSTFPNFYCLIETPTLTGVRVAIRSGPDIVQSYTFRVEWFATNL